MLPGLDLRDALMFTGAEWREALVWSWRNEGWFMAVPVRFLFLVSGESRLRLNEARSGFARCIVKLNNVAFTLFRHKRSWGHMYAYAKKHSPK
jgi:hypothetical protein